ncbi:MAG: FecR family protein [Woeseiaceae bacterium]
MSTTGNNGETRTDDAVEALLEQAMPRPAPPSKDEQMIKEAVFSEWQAVTSKRKARTRLTRLAVAASVLLGVAVSFNLLNNNGVATVQVATISTSHGSIHVLGAQSEVHDLTDLTVITAGQTIKTNSNSGIGLEWENGGSLRIASGTRVEFVASDEIYLRSGKVYFDSIPSDLIAAVSAGSKEAHLRILTDQGVVTHFGTQYMTESSDGQLIVSVREGEVLIDGNYHDERALQGQQLRITGSARASFANIPSHGEFWSWIEDVAPVVDTDGRSVDEFLTWVSRETGLEVVYEDPATEQAASEIVLTGSANVKPREALDLWLSAQDLNWYIDGGTIIVSSIDGSSGR